MKKLICLLSAIALTAIATCPVIAAERQPNPRLIAAGQSSKKICYRDETPDDDGYYWSSCFKFAAIVDIDTGYLRVWTSDDEGNRYVISKKYRGEIVYVSKVFKANNRWYGMITNGYYGCNGCYAYVDLAYLR